MTEPRQAKNAGGRERAAKRRARRSGALRRYGASGAVRPPP